MDEGVEMIGKPFTYASLVQKVADVLERGRTGRVLLAGDDPSLRMFAAETVSALGYSVDEAANRTEALARLRVARGRYDVLILDLGDVGELMVAELRAMHADLPILVASTEGSDEKLTLKYADDPCIGVIARPYNPTKLTSGLKAPGVPCR